LTRGMFGTGLVGQLAPLSSSAGAVASSSHGGPAGCGGLPGQAEAGGVSPLPCAPTGAGTWPLISLARD
jgi:hypothetical protein